MTLGQCEPHRVVDPGLVLGYITKNCWHCFGPPLASWNLVPGIFISSETSSNPHVILYSTGAHQWLSYKGIHFIRDPFYKGFVSSSFKSCKHCVAVAWKMMIRSGDNFPYVMAIAQLCSIGHGSWAVMKWEKVVDWSNNQNHYKKLKYFNCELTISVWNGSLVWYKDGILNSITVAADALAQARPLAHTVLTTDCEMTLQCFPNPCFLLIITLVSDR